MELLHRNLRQYGTVYNTLAAVCDVHGRVVAVQPAPGQIDHTAVVPPGRPPS